MRRIYFLLALLIVCIAIPLLHFALGRDGIGISLTINRAISLYKEETPILSPYRERNSVMDKIEGRPWIYFYTSSGMWVSTDYMIVIIIYSEAEYYYKVIEPNNYIAGVLTDTNMLHGYMFTRLDMATLKFVVMDKNKISPDLLWLYDILHSHDTPLRLILSKYGFTQDKSSPRRMR